MNKEKNKHDEKYLKALTGSRCETTVHSLSYMLTGLDIRFYGRLTRLPAKSNSKSIFRNKKTGKPIIVNSSQCRGEMKAMTDLFCRSIAKSPIKIISFGDRPVHVHVFLANRKGRWDSHNTTKLVGDWLESVGIIEDDCNATIWASKHEEDYTSIVVRFEVEAVKFKQEYFKSLSSLLAKKLT